MDFLLKCEICAIDYNSNDRRPKSLPCGHSMCASCVKENLRVRRRKMACPFCRIPCGTGVKTLDDFPTTFPLLNFIDNVEQKSPSKTFSKEKEEDILQQKKQAECDRTVAHILNSNEHLQILLNAKETQESTLHSIRQEQKRLEEEEKKATSMKHKLGEGIDIVKGLEEEEKKATSMKHKLGEIVAEGNDIVKGLEALQDCVRSASSLPGLNMAIQYVQRYYSASQEWVTFRVKTIIKGNTHLTKEEAFVNAAPEESTKSTSRTKRTMGNEINEHISRNSSKHQKSLSGSKSKKREVKSTKPPMFYQDDSDDTVYLSKKREVKSAKPPMLYQNVLHDKPSTSSGLSTNLRQLVGTAVSIIPTSSPQKMSNGESNNIICTENNVPQGVECRRNFSVGELLYSCLQCPDATIVLCGTCFVNSEHLNHYYEIQQSTSGAFCDCGGIAELYKREPTCKKHLREDKSPLQAFSATLQSSSKCKEVFFKGEKCYTCLDCRTRSDIIMCGSCYINSSHSDYRYEIYTTEGNGAFCYCGYKEVWKMKETCEIHK